MVAENVDQARNEGSWRVLFARVWQAVCDNRALVIAMLAVGLGRALFEKLPFLLLKPFFRVVGEDGDSASKQPDGVPDGAMAGWGQALQAKFDVAFHAFSSWLANLLPFVDTSGEHGARIESITGIVALGVVFGVLGGLGIYGVIVLSRYFAAKIVVDLRNEVAAHLLQLPLRFFGKQKMGQLISTLTADTQVLSRSLTVVSDHSVTDPALILFNFLLVCVYVPDLWWMFFIMVPLMVLPMVRTGRKIRKNAGRSLDALGEATESMNQMLSGIKTVKAFQLEDRRQAEFVQNNAMFLHRTKRMLQAKGMSQGLIFVIYNIALAVMLGLLAWWIITNAYQPHQVLIAAGALATTYAPLKRLSRAYNTLSEALGALGRIQSILGTKRDVSSSQEGIELQDVRGEVAMRDVSFAYDDQSGSVLRNVSFEVPAGKMVAFVGPTGSGKSTAMDLLARFFDPVEGVVCIDGHDFRDIRLDSYRRRVAMVNQSPFLFNASLFDNIQCGRPGASQAEVEEAARQAQIHDFIASLPEGYQTNAAEGGGRLSGGEKQRITIARAILRDPRVLFLDEATSALDSEKEFAVQTALDNLMRGRTSFVIAHRLTTIRGADLILVFERGQVVERGTHEELLALGGLYHRLCALQDIGAT